MKPEQKSLRIGAAVIALAVLLRLSGSSLPENITRLLTSAELTAAMLYLGTGRVYHRYEPTAPDASAPLEESPPEAPSAPTQTVFAQEDAVLVSVTNYPGYDFDVEALLTTPLSWDLTIAEPTVLIYHSHASESYENTENYTSSDPYRTQDTRYNMISVGEHLKQRLEEYGICVIHDTTLFDYPDYDSAYRLSRTSVAAYLQKYPSICLVLDIHRDAYEDASGHQAKSTVRVNGASSSRLMVVAGTDNGGENHSGWEKNLSTAVKLQAVLEKLYPGLCRPVAIRSSAFNQDMSPGALLIEVGTAGDTRQDALNAAEFLADGIYALAHGSQ